MNQSCTWSDVGQCSFDSLDSSIAILYKISVDILMQLIQKAELFYE